MRSFSPAAIFVHHTIPSNPHQHHHKGVCGQRAAKRSLRAIGSLFSPTIWFIFLLHPSLFLRMNSHLLFCPSPFGLLQYYLQCSQSLTLYFRLVSPFPHFCFLSTLLCPSPLLLHLFRSLPFSFSYCLCTLLSAASWKNRLGQCPVTRRVDLGSARKTERENGRKKMSETETERNRAESPASTGI